MTGYKSKKAAAQALAQPAQEPVAVQKSGIANSPSDPEICNERSAQACGPVYCGDSGGYCNKCAKQKIIPNMKPCKGMNCGCTDGRSHSFECQAELAAAIAGGVFVQEVLAKQPAPQPALKLALEVLQFNGNIWHMDCKKDVAIAAIKEALAQPEQERTDYAVHLNHCNIGECQGVCKYLDDDCPALKHADMKAKWDSPATQQPAQEPVAWIEKDIQCDDFDPDSMTCEKPNIGADGWEWIPLYTVPPQRKPTTTEYQSGYYDGKKAALSGREWNFCERCGKRTADLTVIHTCTPPQENNN